MNSGHNLVKLTLTDSAIQKIAHLTQEAPHTPFFRIMVSGGGCSGFQYTFSLDAEKKEDDQIIEIRGVKLIIDAASLPFLDEIELDYSQDLMGESFQIKNPNASTSCGCGNSFSI